MKNGMAILALMLATNNASALHYFNCSSADQKLAITEQEIWGTNPVSCHFGDQVLGKVTLNKDTEILVSHEMGATPRDWERTFVVTATVDAVVDDSGGQPVSGSVSVPILCREVSTSQVDFAVPRKPCAVEYK